MNKFALFWRDYHRFDPIRIIEEQLNNLCVKPDQKVVLLIQPGRACNPSERMIAQRLRQTSMIKAKATVQLGLQVINAYLHEIDPAVVILNIQTDFFDLTDSATLDYLASHCWYCGIYFMSSGYNVALELATEFNKRKLPVIIGGVHATMVGIDYLKGLFVQHLDAYPQLHPVQSESELVLKMTEHEDPALHLTRYLRFLEQAKQLEQQITSENRADIIMKFDDLLTTIHHSLTYDHLAYFREHKAFPGYDLYHGDPLIKQITAVYLGQIGSPFAEFHHRVKAGYYANNNTGSADVYGSLHNPDTDTVYRYIPTWREQSSYAVRIRPAPAPWQSFWEKHGRLECVVAQRGCARPCTFCSVRTIIGKPKAKSASIVLEELKQLSREGVRKIGLVDDNTVGLPGPAEELFQLIIAAKERGELHRNISFFTQASISLGDNSRSMQNLRSLMRQAGVEYVLIGIETLDEQLLSAMNKHQSIQEYEEYIHNLHHDHLLVAGSMIIGNPGESLDNMVSIANFGLITDIDILQISVRMSLPGTEDWYRDLQEQKVADFNFEKYDGNHATLQYQPYPDADYRQALCALTRSYYSLGNLFKRTLNKIKFCNNKDYGVRDALRYIVSSLVKDILYWHLSRQPRTPFELLVYMTE